jgi:hypothetical protein
MTVRLTVRFARAVTDPVVGLWVSNQSNILVYANNSFGHRAGNHEAGSTATFDITMQLHLVTGTYTLGCWAGWGGIEDLHTVRAPARLFYVEGLATRGVADLAATFQAPTGSREAASDPRAP